MVPDLNTIHAPGNRHPIGFTKINLINTHALRIRLHIWNNKLPHSELPHQHRWYLIGIPLWGTFTETRYRITPGTTHRAITAWHSTAPGGRRYATTPTTAKITPTRTHTRRPLIPYTVPLGDIHSATKNGNRLHISLVILGPTKTTTSTIWEPHDQPQP